MKFLACLLICLFSLSSWAANVSITPTSIVLNPTQNSSTLTFTNRGDKPLTLQIFVKSWRQDADGNSLTEDSRDLVVFPKMLRLESGQARPIRIGYQKTWSETEQAFRIFADELPTTEVNSGVVGVIFPVRLSIPVFVRQQTQDVDAKMLLTSAEIHAGSLRFQVKNEGKQHFALDRIEATLLGQDGKSLAVVHSQGGRVLAEQAVFFSLPVEKAMCEQVYAADIQVSSQTTSQNQHFSLSSAGHCSTQQ